MNPNPDPQLDPEPKPRPCHDDEQVTPVDFVVKNTPAAPKGAPAFSEYEYTIDPFYVSQGQGAEGGGGE